MHSERLKMMRVNVVHIRFKQAISSYIYLQNYTKQYVHIVNLLMYILCMQLFMHISHMLINYLY